MRSEAKVDAVDAAAAASMSRPDSFAYAPGEGPTARDPFDQEWWRAVSSRQAVLKKTDSLWGDQSKKRRKPKPLKAWEPFVAGDSRAPLGAETGRRRPLRFLLGASARAEPPPATASSTRGHFISSRLIFPRGTARGLVRPLHLWSGSRASPRRRRCATRSSRGRAGGTRRRRGS